MSEPLEFTPGMYRHYKGGLYTAIGLVRHHDTGLPIRAPHPGAIAHSFDCPALARDVGDGAKR